MSSRKGNAMARTAPTVPHALPPGARARRSVGGRSTLKLAILGVVLVALGAIIGFSISREIAQPTASAPGGAPVRVGQHPSLSPDEQAYVDALWPIHTDVEVAAERVALGAIFYKVNDLDQQALKSRLDESLLRYQSAESRLRELHPPASLQSSHETYLRAIGLFAQSTVEMLRLFDDGSEAHLQAGYPPYLEATNKIRDLGGRFWPDEFPPN
jgi:hypothetical protein